MKTLIVILNILISTSLFAASEPDKAQKRMEDLFIWKISEELSLDPKQETELAKILQELRQQRIEASEKMSELAQKMEDTKNELEMKSLLKDYNKKQKLYLTSQSQELDKIGQLIGSLKLGQYIALKDKLLSRLRESYADNRKPSTKGQNQPKVLKDH